ncbi:MAG TPA: glycosyl hydrolase [Gemmatimonadaceae bacterium]|nr:glycosyl hydrolase [Gemmatimonadaceae bacterium]
MQSFTLARAVGLVCATVALTACESPPERLAGPSDSRKAVVCEEGMDCNPPDPTPTGVVGRFGLVIHDNATSSELSALSALHVNLVRLTVDWGHERLIPGWADLQMQALHDAGVDVLATVAYRYTESERNSLMGTTGYETCTDSTYPGGCIPTGAAWDQLYADWVSFVGTLVANNKDRVKYWSPWNEANEHYFFTGADWQYNALASALCNAVRANSTPTAPLYCVGPELAIHRPGQAGYGTEWSWLSSTMAAANFDIIAVHWYQTIDDVKAKVNYVKSQYPGKPVWVTESAMADPTWREPAADPEFQEQDLVAKWLDLKSGWGPIDALFYYDLHSRGGGITQDFNPRPAYYALKRLNEGIYADPTPGNCSTATGNALCAYTSWIPEGYGCRMDVYARNSTGQPVMGVTIAANEATTAWGYQELGTRKTNAAGVASFTAHCDHDHTARFVTGTGFVLKNWWAPTTSPVMRPSAGNIGLYTFIVAP